VTASQVRTVAASIALLRLHSRTPVWSWFHFVTYILLPYRPDFFQELEDNCCIVWRRVSHMTSCPHSHWYIHTVGAVCWLVEATLYQPRFCARKLKITRGGWIVKPRVKLFSHRKCSCTTIKTVSSSYKRMHLSFFYNVLLDPAG